MNPCFVKARHILAKVRWNEVAALCAETVVLGEPSEGIGEEEHLMRMAIGEALR